MTSERDRPSLLAVRVRDVEDVLEDQRQCGVQDGRCGSHVVVRPEWREDVFEPTLHRPDHVVDVRLSGGAHHVIEHLYVAGPELHPRWAGRCCGRP